MTNEPSWRQPLSTLLRTHSVETGEFVLASGAVSDLYVDVRRTALLGEGAYLIGCGFLELIDAHCPDVVGVGGMTLGADPLVTGTAVAAHVRDRNIAAVIVRKRAKDHGAGRAVEKPKTLRPGDRLAAVDDTVTTGGSTRAAIERLRENGFLIDHALCVVDRQEGAARALAEVGVELHPLFRLDELVG